MADSRVEQVAAAIQAQLAGIVADGGATYWYTPAQVRRVPQFYGPCLDPKKVEPAKQVLYFLSQDRVERRPYTNRETDAEIFFDLVGAFLLPPAAESVWQPQDPPRWELQNRMAQDVERKLCAGDGLLGGLAHRGGLQVTLWDFSPEATYLEGWALIFGRLTVPVRYPREQP